MSQPVAMSQSDLSLLLSSSTADERSGEMIYRRLGRTGERVSAIGLGGFHLGVPAEERDAIRLVRCAVDRGMTFMDNCWDYMDGKCEIWMGNALRDGYREKVFLMTKFDGRTKASAAAQIDESLRRLQTDCVDLMQYHETDPHGRSGPLLQRWRGGCAVRSPRGRQDPLYRLHRAQGPGGAPAHAGGGGGARLPLRCGADAAQHFGCAISQLRPTGGAAAWWSRKSRCSA